VSADALRATPLEMFFDQVAVRLNGPKAADKKVVLNLDVTDLGEQYVLTVEHGVLNYAGGRQAADADVTVTLTRKALDALLLGEATLPQQMAAGEVKIGGRVETLGELQALLDNYEFWFNIVEP
jgi:alkyl sulfatase BDS1-like metallo-beta-lactamase superfamily hydrolase